MTQIQGNSAGSWRDMRSAEEKAVAVAQLRARITTRHAANLRCEAALKYVALGWSVVPLHWIDTDRCSCPNAGDCKTPGKHPHASYAPHGTHSASKDAATVRSWYEREPRLNVGIALGEASGIVVLDVDPRNGGDDTLQNLIAAHGPLPETASAITGGGGTHYVFRDRGQRVRSPGPGLDALSNGKLIVVEPSTHVSGRAYAWDAEADPLDNDNPAPIAEPPTWLLSPISTPAPSTAACEFATPEQIVDLRSALNFIRSDDRATWIANGCRLRGFGEVGRELWITWGQQSPKWKPSDAQEWDTLGHDRTGFRAIFAEAQARGWINPLASHATAERAQKAETALHLVPLGDLRNAANDAPRYAIEPLVPRGVVTLLGAHGGTGKSMLALVLAAHFAAGRPWARFSAVGGPVLFVSLEDPGSLVRYRLSQIATEYSLPLDALAENLRIVDGSEGDGALAAEATEYGTRRLVQTATMDEMRVLIGNAKLIVIDNASDAYDANENDRRMVRSFVRMLAQIARKNDAGVLLLAHIDKSAAKWGAQGNSYSGSTAWHNSARSRLALTEKDGTILLQQEKINLGRVAEPLALRFTDSGVLIPHDGKSCESDRIAQAVIESADAKALLAAFQAAASANVSIPTGRTGPSTAQKVLETIPELPAQLRKASGRAPFWAALERLRSEGAIAVQEYQNSARKKATRFIIAPRAPV